MYSKENQKTQREKQKLSNPNRIEKRRENQIQQYHTLLSQKKKKPTELKAKIKTNRKYFEKKKRKTKELVRSLSNKQSFIHLLLNTIDNTMHRVVVRLKVDLNNPYDKL